MPGRSRISTAPARPQHVARVHGQRAAAPVVADLRSVEVAVPGQARPRVAHEHAALEGRSSMSLLNWIWKRPIRGDLVVPVEGQGEDHDGGTFGRSGGGGRGLPPPRSRWARWSGPPHALR